MVPTAELPPAIPFTCQVTAVSVEPVLVERVTMAVRLMVVLRLAPGVV